MIFVLSGNEQQFREWVRTHVRRITDHTQLQGIANCEIVRTGDWYRYFSDHEVEEMIERIKHLSKSKKKADEDEIRYRKFVKED